MLHIQFRHWPFLSFRRETFSSQVIGWMALAVCIAAGSTYSSFAKQLSQGLSSFSLLFVSELLTGFFVLLSFGTIPTIKNITKLQRSAFPPLILVGLLNGTLAPLLLFTGLRWTSAVNTELFVRSEMIVLLLFSFFFLRETLHRSHLLAGSVMAIGVLFVALHGFREQFVLQWGDGLILLATVVFATGSILFKKFLRNVPHELIILFRSATAVTAFFLLSPFVEHPFIEELRAFPASLFPALLGFAFVSRFLNLLGFYEAIDRIAVSTVSLVLTLNIVTGVAFAHLYLGEPILWYQLIGGSMIMLGVLLLQIVGVHGSEKELEEHIKQHPRQHH